MTSYVTAARDADADIRWRDWQARGAEGDRRRAITMGRLIAFIGMALVVWLFQVL